MIHDVVIVGGGPAGLSAALTLGRARKRVLLCDAGPPRNAAAEHVNGFVTRDGITPADFRRIGREQLAPYTTVEVRAERVEAIDGERGAFAVRLASGVVQARRILLCTGMVDELPELEGVRALWGKRIAQCPYCHAWESREGRFGQLAHAAEMLEFALLLRGWTRDVTVLTDGRFAVPDEVRARLASGGVRVDERRIVRMAEGDGGVARLEMADGAPLELDLLFAHPKQRQVDLVRSLDLALDPKGFVVVDEMFRETSRPGIHAGGDLITMRQGAIIAAAAGMAAAAGLNHALTVELATRGELG